MPHAAVMQQRLMAAESQAAVAQLRYPIEAGEITNPVPGILIFANAAKAHRRVERGEATGAVVLVPYRG